MLSFIHFIIQSRRFDQDIIHTRPVCAMVIFGCDILETEAVGAMAIFGWYMFIWLIYVGSKSS